MELKCRKCGATEAIKNGRVFGWQRHKCKACGYQFTKTSPAGKPVHIKLICHELFMAGLSMREIAKIVGLFIIPLMYVMVRSWFEQLRKAFVSKKGGA